MIAHTRSNRFNTILLALLSPLAVFALAGLPLAASRLAGSPSIGAWTPSPADDDPEPTTADDADEAIAIDWRPSYQAAMQEARERNAIIYVVFAQDSDNVQPQFVFDDPKLAKHVDEFVVMLVGHPKSEDPLAHKPDTTIDPVTKKRTQTCPLYPGITCKQHQKIAADLDRHLHPKRSPCEFIITGHKQIVRDGNVDPIDPNAFAADRYLAALIDAQKRIGKRPVSGALYRRLVGSERDLEAGKYRDGVAKLLAMKAARSKLTRLLRKRLEQLQDAYNKTAKDRIDTAERVAVDDVDLAKQQLLRIASDFEGLPIADRARRTARRLSE